MEEETLGGWMEARTMYGGGVEVEVAQDIGEVGREVNSKGGVGAEAAMGGWRRGCGWMRVCVRGAGGKDLTGESARGDCLSGFVPGSAVEGWGVGIGGGVLMKRIKLLEVLMPSLQTVDIMAV